MLVHLRSYHRKVKKFKHPLLDSAVPMTEDAVAPLVELRLKHGTQEAKFLLVNGLLSSLRHLIGRYLGNWPATRPYMEDMVSEGLLAIVKMVDNMTGDTLDGRGVMHVAMMRASKAIETALYNMGSPGAPSRRTYERYLSAGKEVKYPVTECGLEDVSIEDNRTKEEQDLFDAEEALSVMAARLQLDADLMKPDCCSMNPDEAADLLGVHRSTVVRRREKLRAIYNIEFGG